MIITEEQKQQLQELLTEEEFAALMAYENDVGEFESELNALITTRFDAEDEATAESNKLEDLYYEIYNQNE